jgi:vacuolar-type H+-ATPase subunit E/Vma4
MATSKTTTETLVVEPIVTDRRAQMEADRIARRAQMDADRIARRAQMDAEIKAAESLDNFK